MAWHMKQNLPVFKVTQRSSRGIIRRNVPRGKEVQCSQSADIVDMVETTSTLDPGPSQSSLLTSEILMIVEKMLAYNYSIKQKESTSAWANIR